MSEKPANERTEQATPKRLEEARKRGQIPRSRELSMALVMIAGSLVLLAGRGQYVVDVRQMMIRALSPERRTLADPAYMASALGEAAMTALQSITPLLIALSATAAFGTMAVGGWFLSPSPLAFKFERIDPLKGFGRIFSLNGLVEVVKALAKAGVIGGVAVLFLDASADTLLGLGQMPLHQAMASAMFLSLATLGVCSAALLLIAAVDAPYQLWSYQRQLRMTRQEVMDELKESEGRPEVRSRIRQLQQEVAKRRMLADVATADVVITNPTHFAVALRYEDGRMRAPVVVAKGVDHVAARIRALADEHRVTRFEAPLLARALYWHTDIGEEIPSSLYLAVAQVLTWVYRLKAVHATGAPLPEPPKVEVDAALASRPTMRRH